MQNTVLKRMALGAAASYATAQLVEGWNQLGNEQRLTEVKAHRPEDKAYMNTIDRRSFTSQFAMMTGQDSEMSIKRPFISAALGLTYGALYSRAQLPMLAGYAIGAGAYWPHALDSMQNDEENLGNLARDALENNGFDDDQIDAIFKDFNDKSETKFNEDKVIYGPVATAASLLPLTGLGAFFVAGGSSRQFINTNIAKHETSVAQLTTEQKLDQATGGLAMMGVATNHAVQNSKERWARYSGNNTNSAVKKLAKQQADLAKQQEKQTDAIKQIVIQNQYILTQNSKGIMTKAWEYVTGTTPPPPTFTESPNHKLDQSSSMRDEVSDANSNL